MARYSLGTCGFCGKMVMSFDDHTWAKAGSCEPIDNPTPDIRGKCNPFHEHCWSIRPKWDYQMQEPPTDWAVADEIRAISDGQGSDREGAGCAIDAVLITLLRRLGYKNTAEAYANADIWRA